MDSKTTTEAIRFFRQHAGSSYMPGKETREQARRKSARRLALAERLAASKGWRVQWEQEQDVDLSWCSCDGGESPCPVNGEHEVLCAVLRDYDGKVLGSLGNITDPSKAYGRVVEAELALEAIEDSK